ncbi:MAG TPA: hypothetical protein VGT79_06550 [Xanthomonadaceae bacterium]|nr:hypothetical protein [Xanthomonadaceae bacterium]
MTTKTPITLSDLRHDTAAALRYPAQSASLTTLVALSLSLLLTIAPLFGLVILLVIWATACRYAVEVLDRSANGSLVAPEFTTEPDGVGWTLLILQALFLVVLAWLSLRVETWEWRWIGYAILACLQPAMTLTAAMNRDLGAALNPARLLRVVARLGGAYPLLVIATLLLSSVQHFLTALIDNWLPAVASQMLVGFVWFYLMVLYFHVLGRLVFAYSKELDFIPVPEVPLRPEDRHAPLLQRVDDLVAGENYAGAARELQQCLATEPHASPAMHARYRELLAKIDDQAGLLAHAKTQLSALLVAGNEREALTLLRDSLARDPQFRPAAAEETTRLARAAERFGQHDLALTLLQDFQLRNPRDFDGPANALIAARLLLERRSDVAGTRAVLQAAIDRYLPAHPDHAELLRQLAEIDRLSSRLPGDASTTTARDP